jgi:hypothetical protein
MIKLEELTDIAADLATTIADELPAGYDFHLEVFDEEATQYVAMGVPSPNDPPEVRSLQDEVERLRTESLMAKGLIQGLVAERDAAAALLKDWSNFDFDCPDEDDYDEEPDTFEPVEEGAALERLYDRTGAFLKALGQ